MRVHIERRERTLRTAMSECVYSLALYIREDYEPGILWALLDDIWIAMSIAAQKGYTSTRIGVMREWWQNHKACDRWPSTCTSHEATHLSTHSTYKLRSGNYMGYLYSYISKLTDSSKKDVQNNQETSGCPNNHRVAIWRMTMMPWIHPIWQPNLGVDVPGYHKPARRLELYLIRTRPNSWLFVASNISGLCREESG